jgi:hypothetical protein
MLKIMTSIIFSIELLPEPNSMLENTLSNPSTSATMLVATAPRVSKMSIIESQGWCDAKFSRLRKVKKFDASEAGFGTSHDSRRLRYLSAHGLAPKVRRGC